jgi:hypothetical protein
VAFPSRRTTIAAAASIPTPATATSAANFPGNLFTAIMASVMSTLTTTTTGSLPAAAAAATAKRAAIPIDASDVSATTPGAVATDAIGATPSAGQKRKARP